MKGSGSEMCHSRLLRPSPRGVAPITLISRHATQRKETRTGNSAGKSASRPPTPPDATLALHGDASARCLTGHQSWSFETGSRVV